MDFKQAKPIWPNGLEREMNITCGIWTEFSYSDEKTVLRVTGCSLYRAFVNGKLAAYGPARAYHHAFRIDECDLKKYAQTGRNILYIETVGYNINTFYTLDQPSFIQAELQVNNDIVAATGCFGFSGRLVNERIRKTPKYSFQRPFTEAWKIDDDYYKGYLGTAENETIFVVQPEVKYLARNVQYPRFDTVYPSKITASGIATDGHKRESYHRDRAIINVGPVLKGYKRDEFEVDLNDLAQEFEYTHDAVPARLDSKIMINENHYAVFGYDKIDAGFPAFHVECENDMVLWLIWDEILTDKGDVDFDRHIECVNSMRLELKAGKYDFTGFEAYVYMGMKFIAQGGACTISDVRLIEYTAPIDELKPCPIDDPEIKTIYDAAVNSYRLCCLESFMDDPSRERNDCLFDSYFMACAEFGLTGSYAVNRNMMEAYCYADDKDFLPLKDGQVPMMYPGDHYDGLYSPTHHMWMVIQFNEYVRNSGDRSLIEPFKKRIYRGCEYFHKFINSDGLLEKLPGWIFIDWEEANDAAEAADVSYVANMIYAAMLDSVYELYGDEKCRLEAEKVRIAIREQSLSDGVFHDTAIRDKKGVLRLTDVVTQACQTYALLFQAADAEKDIDVLNSMLKLPKGMTPQHSLTQPIRLSVIIKYIGKDAFLSELKRVYLYQAVRTGSLWEDDTPRRNMVEAIHAGIIDLFDVFR